jgi:hypothetical protein
MEESQRVRNKSPRNAVNCSSPSCGQTTLSEGSIPHSEETRHLVNIARAEQFRRLIYLVVRQDRVGLIEMGRTINIPALLGTNQFDPDNFMVIHY